MARSPYPGLRPFERDEADIFFGREAQVDAMVDRLARQRFLAVTGSSGCGKSSLVRAGLLEALEMGLLAEAGPDWRFAVMRPREQPMAELADALARALGDERSPEALALRRASLDRGPQSLLECLRERPLPEGVNLLILVDQFEELFRYSGLASREQAEAFVALLLATANRREQPVYIVLTMRADFFGECVRFEGLAERICDALYLCPRLARSQIIEAIEGPARVFGGCVEPRLVARILNDMGGDPDQLPLMQHALMRLWDQASARAAETPLLRLDDYLAADGLKGSLSRHADEILAELAAGGPERGELARRMFCLLTEGEGDRAVRRPAPVREIMDVTEQPLEEVAAVADAFRAPGRGLLTPPPDRALTPDTVLDIGHESLIRQWDEIKQWRLREAGSLRRYREAERHVERWAEGNGPLWNLRELRSLLAWRGAERPNRAWAARYGGDFAQIDNLLEQSRVRWQRVRYAVWASLSAFLIVLAVDTAHDLWVEKNFQWVPKDISIAIWWGAIIFGILLAIFYRAVRRNFQSGRNVAIVIFIIALGIFSITLGFAQEEREIETPYLIAWLELLVITIGFGVAFFYLRKLAAVPRPRWRRPIAWLRARLPRWNGRSPETLPAILPPEHTVP